MLKAITVPGQVVEEAGNSMTMITLSQDLVEIVPFSKIIQVIGGH